MPIDPIENPYRVLRFDKTRRSRKVQPRDPEEKEKYSHEDTKQETKEDTPKPAQDAPKEDVTMKKPQDDTGEKNENKLDSRI